MISDVLFDVIGGEILEKYEHRLSIIIFVKKNAATETRDRVRENTKSRPKIKIVRFSHIIKGNFVYELSSGL
jgi:cell division protein FtsX